MSKHEKFPNHGPQVTAEAVALFRKLCHEPNDEVERKLNAMLGLKPPWHPSIMLVSATDELWEDELWEEGPGSWAERRNRAIRLRRLLVEAS
jgi:hypothetical protein